MRHRHADPHTHQKEEEPPPPETRTAQVGSIVFVQPAAAALPELVNRLQRPAPTRALPSAPQVPIEEEDKKADEATKADEEKGDEEKKAKDAKEGETVEVEGEWR